jgi:hypothetical protein
MVRSCYVFAQPQAERPPLVGCSQLLIQYIHSYPQYWRLFLHPQPEDASCCGDRSPLIKGLGTVGYIISTSLYISLSLGLVQSILKSAYTCFRKRKPNMRFTLNFQNNGGFEKLSMEPTAHWTEK